MRMPPYVCIIDLFVISYYYLDASKIVVGYTHAILLGCRIFARIHCRTIHIVPNVSHRVTGDTRSVFRHVRVDARLATVAVNTARRRTEGHGIVTVVAR